MSHERFSSNKSVDPGTKWVKWPGPGEIRGEGEWCSLASLGLTEANWDEIHRTGYLPTHVGSAPPSAA